MTLIVNLFAGPGSGKSTTRAGVFHNLKLDGYDVEEVPEYAKILTWERRFMALSCQPHIFGEQLFALRRLEGQVEAIITDSPILLGLVYTKAGEHPGLNELTLHEFNKTKNLNIFIKRVKPFNPNGRNQTEEEARAIDEAILETLAKHNIPYRSVNGDQWAAYYISEIVKGIIDGS